MSEQSKSGPVYPPYQCYALSNSYAYMSVFIKQFDSVHQFNYAS